MAPSWLRFGNFEVFYHRDDMDNVRTLADYAINHVVEDKGGYEGSGNQYARFFRNITKKTAEMVAEWQAIGFNHGVMNTDNMSILGLTMDYGPFQIMDYYNPRYTCNHSDHTSRKLTLIFSLCVYTNFFCVKVMLLDFNPLYVCSILLDWVCHYWN